METWNLARHALAVVRRAGERQPRERPRRVPAAAARLSGGHAWAQIYEAGIELNRALGPDGHPHSEDRGSTLVEPHLGRVERAHQLITASRERVFQAGYRDFLPYLGIAGAALASTDGYMTLSARLIGAIRARVSAVLGRDILDAECSHHGPGDTGVAGVTWT
ncbi:hypothetical protein ACFWD7_56625, partial [Streptomyces mirabilis]|uniref:hypothetical protein n=1 Tax=Streptomyces mirabilis TaxID=68239 RepID=UPI00367518ED